MISNLEVQPYGLREFLYNILQKINISDVTYWIFAGTFFLGLTIYSLLTDKKYSQTRKMFNNNIHLYSKEIIFFFSKRAILILYQPGRITFIKSK